MKRYLNLYLLSAIIVATLFNCDTYLQSFKKNISSLVLFRSLQTNSKAQEDLIPQIEEFSINECQESWLKGYVAHLNGDLINRRRYWLQTITCSSEYVGGVYREANDEKVFAEAAVKLRPEFEMSWFWLASLTIDPSVAVGLYKQVVLLNPYFGLAWYRLAENQELIHQYDAAINSYLESCKYLNRGSDCYVRVGKIKEILGNPWSAIYYYRLSIYEGAHQRADELEQQLTK